MAAEEISSSAIENWMDMDMDKGAVQPEALIIGAGSVAEKGGGGKAAAAELGCAQIEISLRFLHEQKSGPIAGATFQRGQVWWVLGKAMEVAVSQGEVALRELVTGNESEGHFFGFAASFVTSKESTCRTKG
jgi:hypothetical protein